MSGQRSDRLSGIFDNRDKMRREYWFDGEMFQMRGADTLNIWPAHCLPWGAHPDLPPDPHACSNCGNAHLAICIKTGFTLTNRPECSEWTAAVRI